MVLLKFKKSQKNGNVRIAKKKTTLETDLNHRACFFRLLQTCKVKTNSALKTGTSSLQEKEKRNGARSLSIDEQNIFRFFLTM